ncbi:MAG TPA: hypothetical protein DCL86_08750 [Bacteroidales bacterium]|nr:hypothetical protein [Bacteroidales bacterium]
MRIKEIEINNYRSCVKTKFELQDNLTALIGINGVGKSNILNALQLLTKSRRNRRYFDEEHNENLLTTKLNLTLEYEEKLIFLRANIFYETDERNTDEIFNIDLKYRLENTAARKWNKLNNEFLDVADFMNKKGLVDVPKNKQFQTEKAKWEIKFLQHLNKVNYYSATQFSDPSKCPISFELEDSRLARSYRREATHEYFMYELHRTFKTKPETFKLFLNTVNGNGIQIIDDFQFIEHEVPSSSYKVRAGGKIEKIEKTRKIVIPSAIVDGLNLSPNQLSEGTFKTLALVFYIINDESELLLIEEPEVCIHHGLLNSLIELIQIYSKNKQIVISTHSDYVLDKLEPENVLLVRKDNGTQAKRLTKSLTNNEFKALKDYLDNSGNLGEYWKEGGFEDE